MVKFGATFKPSQQLSLEFAKLAIFSDFGTLCVFKKPYTTLKSTHIDQQLASIMQNGPQETINLPPGAQKISTHLAFFLMWDHCVLQKRLYGMFILVDKPVWQRVLQGYTPTPLHCILINTGRSIPAKIEDQSKFDKKYHPRTILAGKNTGQYSPFL